MRKIWLKLRSSRLRENPIQACRIAGNAARSTSFWGSALQDVRFGIRLLFKNPGFTTVAAATLALCIGANLAIFAVVDAILLRPLPFPRPERLVALYNLYPKTDMDRGGSSFPNLYGRRGKIQALSSVAAYKNDAVNVGEPGTVHRAEILRVSSEFFETLGAGPVAGRSFTEDEMTYQTHHVAILSDTYWRRHFDANPDVLGRKIRVNGFDKTIIGVLPPSFRFLSSKAQLFLPLSSSPEDRDINSLHNSAACEMIGRLAPGATLEQAQEQVRSHNEAVGKAFPYADQVEATGFYTAVAPLREDHAAAIRPTLLLLQSGGLFLLLIGAVNLVNLLLVRASVRSKELAIRQSLGASRMHVLRQTMTETLLLTLIGGACGLGAGAAVIRLLSVFGADKLPLGMNVAFDFRIASAAFAGAIALGIVIGIPIAWFNLHGYLASALNSEVRGGAASHAAQRLRHSFLVAQIALAFILLTGAGLLSSSLKRAMEISPGFQPDRALAGRISMLHKNFLEQPARLQFAERVYERLKNMPGIQAAGIANNLPASGKQSGNQRRVMTVSNPPPDAGKLPLVPHIYGVVGDYFHALGIPLRSGRLLDAFESRRDEKVCVVDEAFARRNWPNAPAVGQLVYNGPENDASTQSFRVVGVVGSVKQTELTEQQSDGVIYFPFRDHPLDAETLCVVVRTGVRSESMGPALQKAVRSIEPELPMQDIRPMDTVIAETLILRRSPLLLAGAFAAVALLLAAIGTYGVLSFAVTQKRREIGIRMALGALPSQITHQFLALGCRLFLYGTALGVLGAWMSGRAMQSILFHVPALHLPAFASAAVLLGMVTLAACLLPTQRASRVEPMDALRSE